MGYRNNAGRLGSGFISVCFETRWLGQKRGFYAPERPCSFKFTNRVASFELVRKKEIVCIFFLVQVME